MKIYTRAGDRGDTGLFGINTRVSKDDARVEAYGSVDELNCTLGAVRAALPTGSPLDPLLGRIQSQLLDLGAELATPAEKLEPKLAARMRLLDGGQTAALEAEIDRMDAALEPLKTFILPGGTPAAAALHIARAVCRRAERRAVTLAGQVTIRPEALRYLNRLSDLLFTMARYANHLAGVPDTPWHPS